ncbi:MAG TPA: peptigoglycan-binding protein LysM [Gammaproteobacteria bacterium]|nr:peptigoglycan-binding protein LysM [Gammaproteobacteria bacterium]
MQLIKQQLIGFVLLCMSSLLSYTKASTFELAQGERVVGYNIVVYSRAQDTLLDIGRQFNIGYTEMVNANPGVDVWLPGEGQPVIVPNRFILPDVAQEGIVVNLAEMRLFYYPETSAGEKKQVITYPIGIGREGWQTPLGKTKIIQKRKDPTWTPPASIKAEHLANDDPLPDIVPAGPDNPLGAYALRLGKTSYLLHGTNRPYGVGLRVSHGCLRLYPEDIEALFSKVSVNIPVNIIYHPYKAARYQGKLYMEAHQTYEDLYDEQHHMQPMVEAILNTQKVISDDEWLYAQAMLENPLGVVQQSGELQQPIIDRLWFVHTGLAAVDQQRIHQVLDDLGYSDALTMSKDAINGPLIGPFDSYQEAESIAISLDTRTPFSAWVVQLPDDIL